MTHVLVLLVALLIGVVAGLRALTAPAVVAWAAALNWIDVGDKWSSWVGHPITAPAKPPMMMRATNCGGLLRLGVFGS